MIPGFNKVISLTRPGLTGQDSIGSPVMTNAAVWTKNGHYQQAYHQENISLMTLQRGILKVYKIALYPGLVSECNLSGMKTSVT